MMKIVCSLALVAAFACGGQTVARADHAHDPALIKAVQWDVDAIKRNAAIYQRQRVNRRADCLVADARKMERLFAFHSCLTGQKAAFRRAVSTLASARIAGDPERVIAAAEAVPELRRALLANDCGKC